VGARVYIDIDGVLRPDPWVMADGSDEGFSGLETTFVEIGGERVPVRFRPAIIANLNDIFRRYDIDPVWLTTWGAHAELFAGAVGLHGVRTDPTIEVEPWGAGYGWDAITWWKTSVVLDALMSSPDSTVLWIDDQIHHGLRHHLRDYDRLSWVAPSRYWGITPAGLKSIQEWAEHPEQQTRWDHRQR
jgi:hypothetical protein